ncbi:MAG: CNNM domain-containing protein [Limisphaera sp.]|nr:CNNM domain-containing protein [Limisphaera sp.]
MSADGGVWAGVVVALAVSFLLSGMEAGLFALNRLRIRHQARQGRSSAQRLLEYLERPERFLWTIVVGNTLANVVVLGWMFLEVHRWTRGSVAGLAVGYAAGVYLFYTFFDLLPKMWFRTRPNRLCTACAPVFRLVDLLLRPAVYGLEAASRLLLRWTGGRAATGRLFGNREEMRAIMLESAQAMTSAERAMILRVLELSTLTVRQLMQDWDRAPWISAETPVGQLLERARREGWSQVPVRGSGARRDSVLGVVSVDHILFAGEPDPDQSVSGWLEPPLCVEENERLEVVLRRMQGSGQVLAVVRDGNGQAVGVLRREDILRLIFGELRL